MIEGSNLNKKDVKYPSEVMFKAIFRNREYILESIKNILADKNIQGDVKAKESKNGKFVSYTVNGLFSSEDELNSICTSITMVDGFMSMF